MRPPLLRLHADELIIDSFAGGGGASLGIELALGRSPDIAINHDAEAIAMHKANHPDTQHYIEDIYDVDPVSVCQGRPVGLAWFSPDCSEHSKAKNGSIVRDKKVRCLANIVHTWAASVRPRVILLENVEEFALWGPLDGENKIDKLRKGEYFQFWWRRLVDMGYQLSMRILKACDYGAPTSRKRLFIIARCDGIDPETCWPLATHGPDKPQPWRTAAECIDYSLPCPSIFMDAAQAKEFKAATGITCKRPLCDKTMQRIRRGIWKYVIGAARPFLVPTNHGGVGRNDQRVYDTDEPMRTVTCAHRGEVGLVSPFVVPCKTWGGGGNEPRSVELPHRTITCSKRGEFALVAPTLIQTGYGERAGQAPRCLDLGKPLGTIIAGGNGNGNGKHALVAAFLEKGYSQRETGGWNGGQPLTAPMGSVTCRDHHHLVAGHMVKLRGTSDQHMNASSLPYDAPVPTISANGNHIGEVRAFLTSYHGAKHEDGDGRGASLDMPLPTQDTSNRYGMVTVDGEEYQIVDIGFRMLEPRELFRAQGFPDSYIIDPIVERTDKRGRLIVGPLTATAQVEKCGNSVCPPIASALARSVFGLAAEISVAA